MAGSGGHIAAWQKILFSLEFRGGSLRTRSFPVCHPLTEVYELSEPCFTFQLVIFCCLEQALGNGRWALLGKRAARWTTAFTVCVGCFILHMHLYVLLASKYLRFVWKLHHRGVSVSRVGRVIVSMYLFFSPQHLGYYTCWMVIFGIAPSEGGWKVSSKVPRSIVAFHYYE